MTKILKIILRLLAQRTISRYHPIIVAITGNIGKTSAKQAIASVLATRYKVRASGGNLNNELGVPLSILGNYEDEYYRVGGTAFFWLKVIVIEFGKLFYKTKYPEILVLEYGADRPGDIAKLVTQFKPAIGVITGIGKVPVHIEFFGSVEAVAEEKSKLITGLQTGEKAILNYDDALTRAMANKTKALVSGYGFSQDADVKIEDLSIVIDDSGEKPLGIKFSLNHKNGKVPVEISGVLGSAHALAAAAGAAAGFAMGLETGMIIGGLGRYRGEAGRMRILDGIKNSVIIDDSYNSSPVAVELALETLKMLPAKRKIAILGDMLELGEFSFKAHEEIGRKATLAADIVIRVSNETELIEVKEKMEAMIEEGDVILIKGSQGMRMEKIVKQIMLKPERASELLVRQSEKWQFRQ